MLEIFAISIMTITSSHSKRLYLGSELSQVPTITRQKRDGLEADVGLQRQAQAVEGPEQLCEPDDQWTGFSSYMLVGDGLKCRH